MASTQFLTQLRAQAPSVTQLPDDVLGRLLAGVPLEDHRAAASACKAFRDVIRGPRFLATRRRYGFEEYGIVEIVSTGVPRDAPDAEIRIASNSQVVGSISGCSVWDGDGSTTDGARMFVSNRRQIWAVDASSRRWKRITSLPQRQFLWRSRPAVVSAGAPAERFATFSQYDHCIEWHGGLLYIAGGKLSDGWGDGPYLNTLQTFNEATGSWGDLPPMPHASKGAVSCVIGNQLFVAGGCNASRRPRALDWLQIYDIVSRTWRLGASIPEPFSREWSSAVRGLAVDGQFFVISVTRYYHTFVYDPNSDTWTVESGEPWREKFWEMDHACVHNGRLVVFAEDPTIWGSNSRARFERASDGSWSSSKVRERRYGNTFVSQSVILG